MAVCPASQSSWQPDCGWLPVFEVSGTHEQGIFVSSLDELAEDFERYARRRNLDVFIFSSIS